MYWPPARGNMAANSPYDSAAESVSTPVRIHVSSNPPAEPVCRVMSAATIKMPEPIIEPTTIIVPSNKPMARTNPASLLMASSRTGIAVSAIPFCLTRCSMVCAFQQFDESACALCGIGRSQDVADDGHRIRTRGNHFGHALQGNSTDSYDRLVRQAPRRANHFQANDGVGIRFSISRKDRSKRNIIRRSLRGCSELLEIMRGNADDSLRPDDAACRVGAKIVLPDVHTARTSQRRHIRSVVDDEVHLPGQQLLGQWARFLQKFPRGRLLVAVLQQPHSGLGQTCRQLCFRKSKQCRV